MKPISLQENTFKDFIKVKGELMFKTGKNPTHDEVLVFLISKYKKNGGV